MVLSRIPTIEIRNNISGGGEGVLARYNRIGRAEEERNRVVKEGGNEMTFSEVGVFGGMPGMPGLIVPEIANWQ